MINNSKYSTRPEISQKLELITAWLTQNSHLLGQSSKMEIVLSLAGVSLKGKITLFPEE